MTPACPKIATAGNFGCESADGCVRAPLVKNVSVMGQIIDTNSISAEYSISA